VNESGALVADAVAGDPADKADISNYLRRDTFSLKGFKANEKRRNRTRFLPVWNNEKTGGHYVPGDSVATTWIGGGMHTGSYGL
jgi:hypothetical protein